MQTLILNLRKFKQDRELPSVTGEGWGGGGSNIQV